MLSYPRTPNILQGNCPFGHNQSPPVGPSAFNLLQAPAHSATVETLGPPASLETKCPGPSLTTLRCIPVSTG